MLGKFASDVNRAVVSYVLDKLVNPDHYITSIKDLQLAISGNDPNFADVFQVDENRIEAEKRWKELQQKLNWKPKHYGYLKKLKRHYSAAYTLTTEATIKTAVLPASEREVFRELFEMYKILKSQEKKL